MCNENKPCIAFEMENLEDAIKHMEYEVVERYGYKCNGKYLFTWDDGERYLCKCKNCGGYILVQWSEFHGPHGDDSYYTDFFPVSGSEEAKKLNEMYNDFEIEQKFPKKYITETNGYYEWYENNSGLEEDTENQSFFKKRWKVNLSFVKTHNKLNRRCKFMKETKHLFCDSDKSPLIPNTDISLYDLIGINNISELNIKERWNNPDYRNKLLAPIGISEKKIFSH